MNHTIAPEQIARDNARSETSPLKNCEHLGEQLDRRAIDLAPVHTQIAQFEVALTSWRGWHRWHPIRPFSGHR